MRLLPVLFSILLIIKSSEISAQDTLIIINDYKFKAGAKFITDLSNDYSISTQGIVVFSGGGQFIYRIGQSRTSIESGIYYITKALNNDLNFGIIRFGFLSIPVNYRIDTKIFYFSFGGYADYFLLARYEYDAFKELDNSDYRKLNLGFNIGIGIEKNIDKNWSAFMEFRSFNNLTSSRNYDRQGFIDPSYSNNGIAIGMNYKL